METNDHHIKFAANFQAKMYVGYIALVLNSFSKSK